MYSFQNLVMTLLKNINIMHKTYCLFDVGQAALSRQPCERLIVSPRRQILIEGPLLLVDTGKPSDMHVILFDDLLLITRKKKALSKKVRAKVSLKGKG